jgi:hypothetical protein
LVAEINGVLSGTLSRTGKIKGRRAGGLEPDAVLFGFSVNTGRGIGSKKAGDGIRTHDLLLGKETFYH